MYRGHIRAYLVPSISAQSYLESLLLLRGAKGLGLGVGAGKTMTVDCTACCEPRVTKLEPNLEVVADEESGPRVIDPLPNFDVV